MSSTVVTLASKLTNAILTMKLVLSCLLLVIVAATATYSTPTNAQTLIFAVSAQAASVSEAAAVASALRAVKGRVLSVQLIESRGPPVYRVKILTEDGRVRTVHVDGQTGEVISY